MEASTLWLEARFPSMILKNSIPIARNGDRTRAIIINVVKSGVWLA